MAGATRILTIAAFCLGSGVAASQQGGGVIEPDPERGRAIAAGAFAAGAGGACQSCHGIDGAGDSAAAFPRLAGQPEEYLLKSLADYASGARQSEIMTPIATQMTEQEMVDAAAFYARTNGVQVPVAVDVTPEVLQHGAALAAIGNAERGVQGCINCHGPAGNGTGFQYPALAGQSALYMRAQIEAWKSGVRQGDTLNVMQEISGLLTEEDVLAVTAYYASIRPSDVIAADTVEFDAGAAQ